MPAIHPPSPNEGRSKPTLIGLFIALCLPLLVIAFGGPLKGFHILVSPAIIWIIGLMLFATMFSFERRPLSSIGLHRPTLGTISLGLASGFAIMLVFPVLQALMTQWGWEAGKSRMTEIASLPLATRIALVLTAGIVEEVLFRGYAMERLIALTGSTWAAASISLTAFVLAHATWNPSHLVSVFVLGGLLTALYAWKRNLTVCILAHTVIDATGFLIVPALTVAK